MKAKKGLKRLLSIALILCMVLAMSLSVFATAPYEKNTAVDNDKQAILQIRVGVKLKDTNEVLEIMSGTGFLINESHLVTCQHVFNFENLISFKYEDKKYTVTIYEFLEKLFGFNRKQSDERRVIQVSVYRDVKRPVDVVFESQETDLALLKLREPLQNMTTLEISPEVPATTAPCYALGFPGLMSDSGDLKTYISDDVTVTGGLVNKVFQRGTVNCIAFSATTGHGGSGGPLVNYNGQVIGIVSEYLSENEVSKDFMNAVDVNELRKVLDRLGIVYVVADPGPSPNPDVEQVEKHSEENVTSDDEDELLVETKDFSSLEDAISKANDYKDQTDKYEKSYADEFSSALKAAEDLNRDTATQDDINNKARALDSARTEMLKHEKKAFPMIPVIIGGAAAVIILVILIILMTGRNKKEPVGYDSAIPPYTPPASSGGDFGHSGDMYGGVSSSPGTTVLGGGRGETTVLGGGDSGATTVLSGGASYGTLTRSKNGERITITRDQFKIGRERSRVDYCINDNTAVGRLHAIIVSRGGSTFVVDQNSTNCTFVNSVRATANQEVRLNNGDKVTFADEEFTYNAF